MGRYNKAMARRGLLPFQTNEVKRLLSSVKKHIDMDTDTICRRKSMWGNIVMLTMPTIFAPIYSS